MKLNRKVLAGALALAMGLGAVAPASQSYADKIVPIKAEADDIDAEAYKKTGEEWLKAYKNLKAAVDEKAELEKEFKDAQKTFFTKKSEIEDNKKEQKDIIDKAEKDIKEVDDKLALIDNPTTEDKAEAEAEKAAIKTKRDEDLKELKTLLAALEVQKDKAERKMTKYNDQIKAGYKYTNKDGVEKTASYDKAIEDLKAIEKEKRADFVKEGATKEDMEAIVKADKVEVPEDRTLEHQIREKIKEIEVKLEALDFIKKNMPETAKRHSEKINTAIKDAEKVLKKANDYLDSLKK